MKYYYANAQNQPTGPLDLAALASLMRAGAITDQTSVIAEGAQTWTTYGMVRNGATSAAIAHAVTSQLTRAGDLARAFSWGKMLYGALLVVISNLVLPWTLLKHAANELAQWGKDRMVPSATSDLPALSQTFIVARPLAHVAFSAIMIIVAVLALCGAGPAYYSYLPSATADEKLLSLFFGEAARQSYAYARHYEFGRAVAGCASALAIAYFGNLLIGLFYEACGLLVRVANDIRRMAAR